MAMPGTAIMSDSNPDPTTAANLHTLARLTGRPKSDLLHAAVAANLKDIEDARAADAMLDRIEAGEEGTLTLDDLDQRLGLSEI
jgi:predicted DNA-binding protein